MNAGDICDVTFAVSIRIDREHAIAGRQMGFEVDRQRSPSNQSLRVLSIGESFPEMGENRNQEDR